MSYEVMPPIEGAAVMGINYGFEKLAVHLAGTVGIAGARTRFTLIGSQSS